MIVALRRLHRPPPSARPGGRSATDRRRHRRDGLRRPAPRSDGFPEGEARIASLLARVLRRRAGLLLGPARNVLVSRFRPDDIGTKEERSRLMLERMQVRVAEERKHLEREAQRLADREAELVRRELALERRIGPQSPKAKGRRTDGPRLGLAQTPSGTEAASNRGATPRPVDGRSRRRIVLPPVNANALARNPNHKRRVMRVRSYRLHRGGRARAPRRRTSATGH